MSLFIMASLFALAAIGLYLIYEFMALFVRPDWPTISDLTRGAVAGHPKAAVIIAGLVEAFILWFYGHVFLGLPPQ